MTSKIEYKITCSPVAVEKIREHVTKRGKDTKGIRLGLRGGGCNGFSMIMEFVDSPHNRDHIFTFDDVSIYVDPKSIVYLNGTEVEYETGLLGHGFKFRIPNQKTACGCGASISF